MSETVLKSLTVYFAYFDYNIYQIIEWVQNQEEFKGFDNFDIINDYQADKHIIFYYIKRPISKKRFHGYKIKTKNINKFIKADYLCKPIEIDIEMISI